MKQTTIFFIILIISSISTFAQTIVLNGEQLVNTEKNKPILKCTPVKITKSMKISEVEGNCNGFWIQKGSETIHKFSNLKDPVGTVLKPGTYYIYPYLKKGTEKADVSVTLKVQSSG